MRSRRIPALSKCISPARVERTLLSAAFDLDLISHVAPTDRCGTAEERRFSATLSGDIGKRLLLLSRLQPRCHPERSMRIRFMNPHAQSKDPCTLIEPRPFLGVLPVSPVRRGSKTGKGTSSTRAASATRERTRLQPLRMLSERLEATVESHPSKNEGWGTRPLIHWMS